MLTTNTFENRRTGQYRLYPGERLRTRWCKSTGLRIIEEPQEDYAQEPIERFKGSIKSTMSGLLTIKGLCLKRRIVDIEPGQFVGLVGHTEAAKVRSESALRFTVVR